MMDGKSEPLFFFAQTFVSFFGTLQPPDNLHQKALISARIAHPYTLTTSDNATFATGDGTQGRVLILEVRGNSLRADGAIIVKKGDSIKDASDVLRRYAQEVTQSSELLFATVNLDTK